MVRAHIEVESFFAALFAMCRMSDRTSGIAVVALGTFRGFTCCVVRWLEYRSGYNPVKAHRMFSFYKVWKEHEEVITKTNESISSRYGR